MVNAAFEKSQNMAPKPPVVVDAPRSPALAATPAEKDARWAENDKRWDKHQDVMVFLKQLSQELKVHTPQLPTSLKDKVDTYIREHGNRHPDTTKTPTPPL